MDKWHIRHIKYVIHHINNSDSNSLDIPSYTFCNPYDIMHIISNACYIPHILRAQ